MKPDSALSRLKDGEICIVTTADGEHGMTWSAQHWCFVYLDRGAPVVCQSEKIEEWRPASIPFSS